MTFSWEECEDGFGRFLLGVEEEKSMGMAPGDVGDSAGTVRCAKNVGGGIAGRLPEIEVRIFSALNSSEV